MKSFTSALIALSLGSALSLQAMAQANSNEIDFGPPSVASADASSAAVDSTASPSSTYDQALQAEVAAAIASDPALQGVALSVSAADGRVTITGSVADESQARHATEVAASIAGATRVTSAIATR